jgi:hypothetical protein
VQREQQIKEATWDFENATARTQHLAKEIEEKKAVLALLIEKFAEHERNDKAQHAKVEYGFRAEIATLVEKHAEAEKREGDLNRKLQALLAEQDEGEQGGS